MRSHLDGLAQHKHHLVRQLRPLEQQLEDAHTLVGDHVSRELRSKQLIELVQIVFEYKRYFTALPREVRLLLHVRVDQLLAQESADALIYKRLCQVLYSFLLQAVRVGLESGLNDRQLSQLLFELLRQLHEVFGACVLVALDHDVVLAQDFDVLEEVVVIVGDFMVDVHLEELHELKWVTHDAWLALASQLSLALQLWVSVTHSALVHAELDFVLERPVEALIDRVRQHDTPQRSLVVRKVV